MLRTELTDLVAQGCVAKLQGTSTGWFCSLRRPETGAVTGEAETPEAAVGAAVQLMALSLQEVSGVKD